MVRQAFIAFPKLALLVSCSIGLMLFSYMSVSAQQPNLVPIVRNAERFDVSRPLAEYPTPPAQILIEREELLRIPVAPHSSQPDPVIQNSVGPQVTAVPGIGFDGVGANGSAPPDTNMAVGPNHIVQWVNTQFAVFDKAGIILPGYPKPGNTLWSGFGGPCETKNDGDPIAQYDRLADRWVMSQLANTSGPTYYQCFAVSTSPDPTSSYNRYAYTFTNSLNDYPKMGVWPSGYFVSYNMFAFGAFFQGAQACAYDRSKMLIGAAATSVCFQLSSSFGGLLPSDLDGATAPPSGSPNFFVNFGTDSLNLWKFAPNFASPSSSTFTGPTNIPVAAFSEACGGGTCIPQSETTQQLDSLADRLMYRLAYRNFGDHEALVVNHAVTAGSSVGERWYEIRSPNATPTIFQQGTYAPDSNYRWMGSAAMDQVGNMAIGYSVSSSSMHPSIRYAGREPTDALGTLQAESSIIEGTGSQLPSLSRWGDYSALRIDPSDDCTFWFTTEYLKANGTFNWSTRIGSFKFGTCGIPPTPPLPPSGLTANAVSSSQINLAWTDNSDNESGFKIERCTGSTVTCTTTGTFAQIAQVGANVTTYSDTGLSASTTYSYRVRAFNSGGDSAYSNVAEATTQAPPPPPAAPGNLTATPVSSTQIN
ncbi:MAG: fibronectin type III domain-containing protein, partial [bacterium]